MGKRFLNSNYLAILQILYGEIKLGVCLKKLNWGCKAAAEGLTSLQRRVSLSKLGMSGGGRTL